MMTKIFFLALLFIQVGCDNSESYKDPYGNKITKEEHEQRVTNDAAANALANFMAECKQRPNDKCPSTR